MKAGAIAFQIRPPFCIYDDCTPIIAAGEILKGLREGGSCFCLGKLANEQHWTSHTTEHHNDCGLCIFTPFKGWTRYVMNADDFHMLSVMIDRFGEKAGVKV